MPQLTVEEQNLVDKVVRQNSQSPLEALRQINKARKKAKQSNREIRHSDRHGNLIKRASGDEDSKCMDKGSKSFTSQTSSK